MAFLKLSNISLSIPIISPDRIDLRNHLKTTIGGVLKGNKSSQASFVNALKNINIAINPGDRIGLMGPNGAGKSTLLKLLAGVYEPTSGKIETQGKTCSLLNMNVGMNVDLTGYQNLISMAYHFGMKKSEINKFLEEMIKFTDLGDFIHLPVRSYSSGMSVRLGYAIIPFLKPEILLLDENIGAGDMAFTNKAAKESDKILKNASIIVMASHDIKLMKKFCNKAIFMEKGEISFQGSVDETFRVYMKSLDIWELSDPNALPRSMKVLEKYMKDYNLT